MSNFSKTAAAAVILSLTLLAGCGNFEWFPKTGTFSNNSTASSTGTKPGTLMKEFPFPTAVSIRSVSDIAYDKNTQSFWLLAETSSSPVNTPTALVQISAVTGSYKGRGDAAFWPEEILNGSTLVYDGNFFWITASGVPGGKVYQVFPNGLYNNSFYNCPDSSTGFCQGLAFDPATSSYWRTGSDSTTLVNYNLAGGIATSVASYSNSLFAGASDLAFDAASNEVFVVNNGIIRINKSSGAYLGSIPFILPGTGRGDWDGSYFWGVDNSSKSIKALFVR